ncbi:hypothetical protein, partial [Massilia sp. TN1-12]|uniref:hypothetical protein n=1 Tax=Massilia paldalensis TaxID=3377675 RepID=UPI00384AF3EB
LEELEGNDPTVGTTADEIIEPEVVDAADALIDAVSAEAADTVASMNVEAADENADLDVDALLDDVGAAAPVDAAAAGSDLVDDLLEDVAQQAASIEAKQKLYAEQDAPEIGAAGDVPQTDADAVAAAGTEKKPRKKKDAAPKEPKPARPTSVTHKPGDLLMAKLGAKSGDYLIFDADPAVNETKVAEFIARMNDRDAIADKVREKIIMLMTWMAGGGTGTLNEVLRRTFTVLAKDGTLTSGDKGNLQQDLLAKPYSMGTARSQANQMFMALPELGLTLKSKGAMVPNPDSIMLQAINAQLGL